VSAAAQHRHALPAHQRWPREVVVERDDGTVSLLADASVVDGTVRARRADDVIREERD
jgi:hypothetical protein